MNVRHLLMAVCCAGLWGAGVTGQAVAATTVYNCSIDTRDSGGWIAPDMVVALPDEGRRAIVSDGLILATTEAPKSVRVAMRGRSGVAMNWTLRLRSGSGQQTVMSYRVTLNPSAKTISVSAKPNGYIDKFSARGTCAVVEQ